MDIGFLWTEENNSLIFTPQEIVLLNVLLKTILDTKS